MDSERAKYQGYLAQYEQDARAVESDMKGIVSGMRDLLNPLEPVARLKADVIFQQASRLAYRQTELKNLLDQIEEAKRILGR